MDKCCRTIAISLLPVALCIQSLFYQSNRILIPLFQIQNNALSFRVIQFQILNLNLGDDDREFQFGYQCKSKTSQNSAALDTENTFLQSLALLAQTGKTLYENKVFVVK